MSVASPEAFWDTLMSHQCEMHVPICKLMPTVIRIPFLSSIKGEFSDEFAMLVDLCLHRIFRTMSGPG